MERGGFHGYRKNSIPNNTNLGNNNNNNNGGEESNECTVREQDRFMPIANVIRIMRKILPAHAKISDDAKETIQECVSEYISFITGEANERCQREQRKTITAEDVLWAMSKLGFDDYVEPLTLFLHRYRDAEGERTGIPPSNNINNGLQPPFKRGVPNNDYAPFAVPPPPYYSNGAAAFYRGYPPPPGTSSGPGFNVGDQHSGQFK